MDIAPLNVLCIEDTVADFLLIERTLRLAGLVGRCERVESSEALTAALAEKRWDLVLSDYAVPGMYFTDTLRRFLHHHPNFFGHGRGRGLGLRAQEQPGAPGARHEAGHAARRRAGQSATGSAGVGGQSSNRTAPSLIVSAIR